MATRLSTADCLRLLAAPGGAAWARQVPADTLLDLIAVIEARQRPVREDDANAFAARVIAHHLRTGDLDAAREWLVELGMDPAWAERRSTA
ncbi:hypothetical protein PVT71_12370 [Salipiger sp. H15]|uniref:Uncharacterized protein n=1 Tax=Alloyangia sp. H15 TaxID=3029062 RepID=A0AAU8AFM9_9RHOB